MSRFLEIAEVLGHLATVGTLIVAYWALRFASEQIHEAKNTQREAKKTQREATAKDLFRDYLKLAFEHPKFANPNEFIGKTEDGWKHKDEWIKDERYRWFVAFVLNACDEVIRSMPRDQFWRKSIIMDLEYHKEYLRSQQFDYDGGWNLYSPELTGLWERRS